MLKRIFYILMMAVLTQAQAAAGERIKLKLAHYSSDRGMTFVSAVKAYVDAVNLDPHSGIEIEPYPSGALGKSAALQPQLVLDGTADIAFVIAGQTPQRFPETAVIELPGLFRSLREATFAYTRVVAAGALQDYRDFVVLGTLATEPESIHARAPITSVDDLNGKRLRTNNKMQAAALEKFGASAVLMPLPETAQAISSGSIDGATVPPGPLLDFGIGRIATYHYFVPVGAAPLAVLMNRKKFESLPQAAQDALRKYSGEWLAARFVNAYEAYNARIVADLQADPRRNVTFPSPYELDAIQAAFASVRNEWAAAQPRNRELLDAVETQLRKLRSDG